MGRVAFEDHLPVCRDNTNPTEPTERHVRALRSAAKRMHDRGSYAVPVADSRYSVTLKFCEGHYGHRNTGVGGPGSCLFDVYCMARRCSELRYFQGSGVARAGQRAARSFGIRPAAHGKIVLNSIPVKGMACVNGIEVFEDSR